MLISKWFPPRASGLSAAARSSSAFKNPTEGLEEKLQSESIAVNYTVMHGAVRSPLCCPTCLRLLCACRVSISCTKQSARCSNLRFQRANAPLSRSDCVQQFLLLLISVSVFIGIHWKLGIKHDSWKCITGLIQYGECQDQLLYKTLFKALRKQHPKAE